MRLKNLIIGDIKFQFKYGFYFVYVVLTILYVSLLYILPEGIRTKAATIMIFSDPAAMGLFFMGAIVLLEKSQRILNSIAVSPVKVSEYIIAKVTSIAFISTIVGWVIALTAGAQNLFIVVIGIFSGSIMFTLLGLIVAAKISSLNQFLMVTIPMEIILFLPPIGYLFGFNKNYMLIHPGCIIIGFMDGDVEHILPLLLILYLWIILFYYIAFCIIKRMFLSVGGVKL